MSQITTHVLNTAQGTPARGIKVTLQEYRNQEWSTIGEGETNEDGRIGDLLRPGDTVSPATYRLCFQLDDYFEKRGEASFYPEATVVFNIKDDQHYHIPLLLSPFGYTTYRGS